MRGKLLNKLADLMEAKAEEFAALESLDVGESLLSYITVSVARTDSFRQDVWYGENGRCWRFHHPRSILCWLGG